MAPLAMDQVRAAVPASVQDELFNAIKSGGSNLRKTPRGADIPGEKKFAQRTGRVL
jgi:hypothetical protein